ncbi:hypothetical protein QQP08_019131 [Theobroma cacao]|nr:hypothetical protein QQP08_019131 [Theobroma cacao]
MQKWRRWLKYWRSMGQSPMNMHLLFELGLEKPETKKSITDRIHHCYC